MKILGVTVSDNLSAVSHITDVLELSSRSLYALRVLRSHGMPTTALHEITRATTFARLLYAAPAWWGFAHAKDRARIGRFISKTMRMVYLPEEFPDVGELVDVAERRLLAAVIHSSDHVLRPLFPPVITRRPGLRRRQHEFIYPSGERRSQFYSSNSISYFKSLVRILCQLFIFIYPLTAPYLHRINSLFCIMFNGVAELRSVDRCRFCIH